MREAVAIDGPSKHTRADLLPNLHPRSCTPVVRNDGQLIRKTTRFQSGGTDRSHHPLFSIQVTNACRSIQRSSACSPGLVNV